jgi:cytochrome c-type biogenesis protein
MASLPDLSLVGFALAAGAVTFLAPCAAPLLPGYVSFYLGRTGEEAGATPATSALDIGHRLASAGYVGLLVSLGVFVVYGCLAVVVWQVGEGPLANVAVLELVVGSVLVALGLAMAADLSLPTLHVDLPVRRRSGLSYLGFGVLYAVAAAGCTAPLFLGITAAALTANGALGVVVVAAYGVGLAVPLVGLTVATALGRAVVLGRFVETAGRIRRVAGILLALAGFVQIYLYLFEFGGLQAVGW